MPLDLFTTILILGSLLALVGGAIGFRLVSNKGKTVESESFTSRLGYLQDENKELRKYIKSAKGALAQTKQGATIDEGTEISEDGFDSIIPSLVGKYAGLLPKNLQFLVRDPAIVSFLLSEAKKNPEQAKEVLKHFISKNGNANTGASDAEREQQESEVLSVSGA